VLCFARRCCCTTLVHHQSFGLNPATNTRWDDSNANNFSKCLVDTGSSNLAVASPTLCIDQLPSGICTYTFPAEYCYNTDDPYASPTGTVSMQ
jgi:hypothetical protein